MQAIRSEDDSGTITIDGSVVNVEFWSLSGAISSIGNAVSSAASSVSNAISSAAETVGNVVSSAAETVGNVVTSAAEVVGSAVSGAGDVAGNALNNVGNAIGGGFGNFLSSAGNGVSGFANTVGQGISGGVSWVNDRVVQPLINTGIELVQDVVPIVAGVFNAPVQLLGSTISGLGQTVGSLLQGDFSGAWSGFKDTALNIIVSPVELAVSTVALSANTVVNAINNTFSLSEERGLSQQEIDYLRPIFGDSIDYSSIQIQSGGIKEILGISPQTTGNDVFLRQEWGSDIFNDDGTLTDTGLALLGHEVGHVWQHQNEGINYVGDALITQGLDAIGIGDGYDISQALQNGVRFEHMNPEQQASVAEFIGMAIQANGTGNLTLDEFKTAAGLDSLSVAEFSIIQDAHEILKR